MTFESNNIFFSSDPHYNHQNICAGETKWVKPEEWPIPYNEWKNDKDRKSFCESKGLRDFETLEEMNNTIINNFNSKIKEDDTLFILGDIGFGDKNSVYNFMNSLNCKNVHLIFGNHDKDIIYNRNNVQRLFKSCSFYKEIYVDNQFIVLSHYAHRVWNRSHHTPSSWMLYGHTHNNLEHEEWGKSMDVGVDTNNYFPYSYYEIKEILDVRKSLFTRLDL